MTSGKKRSKVAKNISRRTDEIQAAIDYGVDISLLIANSKKSYAERIRRHQIALSTVEKLRAARRR